MLTVRNSCSKEIPLIQSKEQQLRFTGAAVKSYPTPKVRVAAKRSNPMFKERQLHGCRRAQSSYSMFKVRRGNSSKVRSRGCALLEQP